MTLKKALPGMMLAVEAAVLDDLRAINRSGQGIAFVCGRYGRALHTITESDVWTATSGAARRRHRWEGA